MAEIDLHTHTTASDGMLSPDELVHAACERQLRVIAITDHDTLGGVAAATAAAEGTQLRVLPGLELSALYRDHSVHLLGYGFDARSNDLVTKLSRMVTGREQRARLMVEKLAELGVPISWQRVVELGAGAIARPHIARVLVETGHAGNVSDAFARFIGDDCPAYLPSGRMTVREAIDVVREAGGYLALAHAMLLHSSLDLVEVLEEATAAGLTGLEVYHTEHDAAAVARLLQLAHERQLWICGGSDFHGPTKPRAFLGGVDVPASVLKQGPFPAALAGIRPQAMPVQ